MIRILMVTDSYFMAGAYWRSSGPFLSLKEIIKMDVMWVEKRHLTWAHFAESDIVFMHRPVSDQDKQIFTEARNLGRPIWVDYDDNLFEVPIDNGTHHIYSDEDIRKNMMYMIANADAVTVSTTTMRDALMKHVGNVQNFKPENIEILTNGFNPRWFWWRQINKRSQKVRVMWRGSKHHEKDLWHVNGHIKKAMKEFPNVEFFFIGHKPWQLFEETENWFHISPTTPHSYMKMMYTVRPDICMVPLADNAFNRCKSNIAQLEAAMAGAVSVVPNWPEVWDTSVGYAYNNPNHFGQCLLKAIDDATKKRVQVNASADAIWNAMMFRGDGGPYNLDVINLKRFNLIRKLTGLKPEVKMNAPIISKELPSVPAGLQGAPQETTHQAPPC